MPSCYINVSTEVDIFDEMSEAELAELISTDVLRIELSKRTIQLNKCPTPAEILNGAIMNMSKQKAKDILCDILGLQHTASYNEICETLKDLI